MKLIGLDYLDISGHFSDEEIMVQHSAREFVENEIFPIIDKHFQDGTFPNELIPKFAEMGFLGINLPTEYGGGGMSNVDYICRNINQKLKKYIISDTFHTKVVKNKHGDSSGVRGAAWLS